MAEDKNAEDLEFYGASVNAYYSTALEHDKSLLTLSAGGIGLLITLLTTAGIENFCILLLYIFAIFFFVVCLISVLYIFNGNRAHIIKLFQDGNDDPLEEPYLLLLDKLAIWSFIIGVIFSSFIGVTTAYYQFVKRESSMSAEKPKTTTGIAMDSYHGAQLLQKSFTGVQALKPTALTNNCATQAPQASATTQPAVSPTQQAAVNSTASSSTKK